MQDNPLVLVVDDETGSRESMAIAIEKAGFAVRTFDDARKALEFLEENDSARLVVCDLRMPGMDGVAFLKEVRERKYDLGLILVTAYGTIESAVEAMRVGADDYLTKPVDLYELRQRVMNLLEKQQLKEEVSTLRQMLDKRFGFESIVGRSAPMERLFEQMKNMEFEELSRNPIPTRLDAARILTALITGLPGAHNHQNAAAIPTTARRPAAWNTRPASVSVSASSSSGMRRRIKASSRLRWLKPAGASITKYRSAGSRSMPLSTPLSQRSNQRSISRSPAAGASRALSASPITA